MLFFGNNAILQKNIQQFRIGGMCPDRCTEDRPATTMALALFLKLQRFIDLVSKIEVYGAEIVAFGGHP